MDGCWGPAEASLPNHGAMQNRQAPQEKRSGVATTLSAGLGEDSASSECIKPLAARGLNALRPRQAASFSGEAAQIQGSTPHRASESAARFFSNPPVRREESWYQELACTQGRGG